MSCKSVLFLLPTNMAWAEWVWECAHTNISNSYLNSYFTYLSKSFILDKMCLYQIFYNLLSDNFLYLCFLLMIMRIIKISHYKSDIQIVKERPGNNFMLLRLNTFFFSSFQTNANGWTCAIYYKNATYSNKATFNIFVFPSHSTQTPMQFNVLLDYDIILGFHVSNNNTFLIVIFFQF